ncbi:MAG: hypothetical protein RJB66_966 [Pseudomonadota bacterium]|jgi:hypothetical protein
MKQIIFSLILFASGLSCKAEPFQDGFRYGTYGIVAGALAGGTAIALSEDPGSNLAPVAKGASLGLYAGLIVAIFKNMGDFKEPLLDVQPVSWGQGEERGMGLIFAKRF